MERNTLLILPYGKKPKPMSLHGPVLNDLFEHYSPEALRLFLLSKQYRRPIDFSLSAMKEASARWGRLSRFFSCNAQLISESIGFGFPRGHLWNRFCIAMDKDFNFPMALSVVFEGIRDINRNARNFSKSMNNDPSGGLKDHVSDIFLFAERFSGSIMNHRLWFQCHDFHIRLLKRPEYFDLKDKERA